MTRSRWFLLFVVGCLLIGQTMTASAAMSRAASEIGSGTNGVGLGFAVLCDPPFNPVRPSYVGPGDFITYTLLLSNTSGLTLTGVVVTNAVPAGASSIAGRFQPTPQLTKPIVWQVPILEPTQTMTMQHVLRVNEEMTVTAIVNIAIADWATGAPMTRTTVHPFGITSAPDVAFYLPWVQGGDH